MVWDVDPDASTREGNFLEALEKLEEYVTKKTARNG